MGTDSGTWTARYQLPGSTMNLHTTRIAILALGIFVTTAAHARETAPAFTLPTLDGAPVSLADYRGDVVLLNFWASWCPPCKAEIPLLVELHARELPGLTIVGVATYDELEDARVGVVEFGMEYTIVFDAVGDISIAYGARGIPTNVVVDHAGRVHSTHLGYLSEERFRATVEAAILGALSERLRPVNPRGQIATTWGRLRAR